ncbi:MAG: 1-deoxy-D-xylulose-5-phosphate reductoisomerase [Gammaproteobacteria bacterium]|nr:1-deoxy-D-xylulose-5-phosphate reductoisomerase [Gammaproteobacteria bacterium]
MQHIVLLGATGSIGASTLDVMARNPDAYQLDGFVFSKNVARAIQICQTFKPRWAYSPDLDARAQLEALGIVEVIDVTEVGERVSRSHVDRVVAAITGFAGLNTLIDAIKAGKTILLANKESLVSAGALVMPLVKRYGATLLPIDSEHNALFQCADGQRGIESMSLTASGGALRDWPLAEIPNATVKQALAHPNWSMGAKVTIDSATMMNKGLELVEAKWLFNLAPDQLDVLIHPQSVIHSLVNFVDGTSLAQLGHPDMRVPIAHALAYPERVASGVARFDLTSGSLEFREMDHLRYPIMSLAWAALASNGTLPTVMNAANEVAVDAFIAGRIRFGDICRVVEQTMGSHQDIAIESLDHINEVDQWARGQAQLEI